LTQTIRKRKRRVLPDNTIINVAGTPAPVKKAKKNEEGEIPAAIDINEEDDVDEKANEPKPDDEDAMDIDQHVTSPKKTPKRTPNKPPQAAPADGEKDEDDVVGETPKRVTGKRKAPDDSQDAVTAKRRRKNSPLENEAI